MSGEFEGLVALVTGGSSGIGKATSQALMTAGATVIVLDVNPDSAPHGSHPFHADVSDRASVTSAIDSAMEQFGRLDVLISCAGISAIGTVEANEDSEWARVLSINVTGIARVTAASLKWLRHSPCASIVNVCSIAALNGLPDRALYGASKGGVLSLTFAMATDHVSEGIRVNCVSPGTVATEFVDRLLRNFADPAAERAAMDARQATGRMVTPEEVATAILYLASPRSGSTTGTALDVDGGVTHLRVRPRG